MLQEILKSGALTHFATIGLVVFVATFVGVSAWVLSRSRSEVDDWARLPLADDTDGPTEERIRGGRQRV